MKANEAPEKIYVHEASATELTEKLPYHIEYIHKDAFIEKACSMLKELGIQNDIIEQFKNKIK